MPSLVGTYLGAELFIVDKEWICPTVPGGGDLTACGTCAVACTIRRKKIIFQNEKSFEERKGRGTLKSVLLLITVFMIFLF